MAQRITLVDDLDGKSEGAETITFSLQGVQYEVDLADENINKLHDALAPFVEAGRQVSGRSTRREAAPRAATAKPKSTNDNAAIRKWATENNIEVSERGRLSNDVIEKYEAAH